MFKILTRCLYDATKRGMSAKAKVATRPMQSWHPEAGAKADDLGKNGVTAASAFTWDMGTWGHGHHLTNEDTLHYLPATIISSGSMIIKFGKGSDIEAMIQTKVFKVQMLRPISGQAAMQKSSIQSKNSN